MRGRYVERIMRTHIITLGARRVVGSSKWDQCQWSWLESRLGELGVSEMSVQRVHRANELSKAHQISVSAVRERRGVPARL